MLKWISAKAAASAYLPHSFAPPGRLERLTTARPSVPDCDIGPYFGFNRKKLRGQVSAILLIMMRELEVLLIAATVLALSVYGIVKLYLRQERRGQAIEAHSVEVEAQDDGGYSVVE